MTRQKNQQVRGGLNQFALELYAQLTKVNKSNLIFSPYSIFSAFAILYEGALEITKTEIRQVLHYPDTPTLRKNYVAFFNRVHQNDKAYKLFMGNALWIQKGTPIEELYLSIIKKYYTACVSHLDFKEKPEEARQVINDFIKKQTQNHIMNLIPSNQNMKEISAVITNALYFKGDWMEKFDASKTKNRDFFVSHEMVVETPMMHLEPKSETRFNYRKFKEVEILELPYKGDELSMYILLPTKNLATLESILTIERFQSWTHRLRPEKLSHIFLPKFEFEIEIHLKEIMQSMGIKSAFSGFANFSKMSKNIPLNISDVFHKAYVKVDEKGTTAIATTAIFIMGFGETSEPIIIFNANHPFIFCIQDQATNNILFMGKITDPKSDEFSFINSN